VVAGGRGADGCRATTGKVYLVCDNYGPHGKAEVRTWCAANDIELVFTPTNASWLNWIECEFTAVRHYLRWRNRHCHPKRHFAVHSNIRRPNYLPKVA